MLDSFGTVPRLIIDINVLLNGIASGETSINRRIYTSFLKSEIRLVFSEDWLLEFERVLEYPRMLQLGIGRGLAARTVHELWLLGEYVAPVPRYDWDSLRDKKDWYLFDLLFEARADAFVTQDKAVLSAGKKLRLPVIHPSELLGSSFLTTT